jgi:hypothetical protein
MNRSLAIVETETREERLRRVYDELADIDPDDLRDALLAITEGAPAQRRTRDLADPGDELPIGVGGAIELADSIRSSGSSAATTSCPCTSSRRVWWSNAPSPG